MKRAAILTGALILVSGSLMYSTTGNALGTAKERAACTPDVFRLCSSSIPSVSAIIACMEAKKSQLSPACRAAFNPPNTKKASQTRSIASGGSQSTAAYDWCGFKGVDHDPKQQDWIKWCGDSARTK
jgi:hypothetical protein